jgi:hypothetical protein
MGSLLNSFKVTKLDLETPGGGERRSDFITKFPATNTGTPTNTANPGAATSFFQKFVPTETYLNFISELKNKSNLLNLGRTKYTILGATNLDVEDSKVDGGIPYKQDKDPTVYPKHVTGTPTTSANPAAASKFKQIYNPKNTFLDSDFKSKLVNTVANTNLDVENEKPNGGIPYKQDKDPTIFPKYVTGTPTTSANPSAPAKFNQVYNPKNVYLDKVPIKSEGKLKSTVANTNLDVENAKPNGGIPYRPENDPTIYPITTQKKSSAGGFYPIQGQSASKYNQVFNPKNTYLDFIKKYT